MPKMIDLINELRSIVEEFRAEQGDPGLEHRPGVVRMADLLEQAADALDTLCERVADAECERELFDLTLKRLASWQQTLADQLTDVRARLDRQPPDPPDPFLPGSRLWQAVDDGLPGGLP